MEKSLIIFLLSLFSFQAYSQIGDFYVGLKGGYTTKYEAGLYGIEAAYHITDQFQLNFTELVNFNLSYKDDSDYTNKTDLRYFSTNLDLHYYLFLFHSWASGITGGVQYLNTQTKDRDLDFMDTNAFGFNVGWYFRYTLTENLKINAGWKYSMGKEAVNSHLFSIGIGYNFSLR
jgi:hypothetical protein